MRWQELDALVSDLDRTAPPMAFGLADRIRSGILQGTDIDRGLFERAEAAFSRRGMRLGVEWTPRTVGIGETYLLLAGSDAGRAARIHLSDTVTDLASLERESVLAVHGAYAGMLQLMAANRLMPPSWSASALSPRFEVRALERSFAMSGDSLGLPYCVAVLSRWLGVAPRSNVAGSAKVDPQGKLLPIGGLDTKLPALRRSWPNVDTLVVAMDQVVPAGFEAFTVLRRPDVLVAAREFGLAPGLDSLPRPAMETLLEKLGGIAARNNQATTREEWLAFSDEAFFIANAVGTTTREGARALGWAALFALHASELESADGYLHLIDHEAFAALDPLARTWIRITRASKAIDTGDAQATALAHEAVEEARAAPTHVQRMILGRALGTLGRTIMHAGDASGAVPFLEEGVAFHAAHEPSEEPRTATYLATCLRLAGHPDRALAEADRALELTGRFPGWTVARLTRLFLLLERGRCLLALKRPEEAADCFRRVEAEHATSDDANPRRGAVRGLAAALRRLPEGLAHSDAYLRRCIDVVGRVPASRPIPRAAAVMAVADALIDVDAGLPCGVARDTLLEAWRSVFRDTLDFDAIRARQVY